MARIRETIQTDPDNPTPAATDKRKRKRVSIYFNDDGTPDLEGVPVEVRQQLGVTPPAAEPEPEPMKVPPEMVSYLVVTLARIESAIVAPRMGLDVSDTMEVLTPAEPILNGISEAGVRVLAKYGGTMGKYQDELVLGMLLIQWQASAFSQLRSMAAAQLAAKEPPPAPIDRHISIESAKPSRTKPKPPAPPVPAPPEDNGTGLAFTE